ncbi:MAG TPA: RHS repeat-associated core domain-containing protein [Solirubrobacteraceae bacterium]|nr:RHS repeat-associated core domain-containing protein [Solirubrobacteraceae bacterium]
MGVRAGDWEPPYVPEEYPNFRNWSPETQNTWPIKIDRSPPTISTSGSLQDAANQSVPEGPYSLHVDVTDGVGSGATARAGVKSVEVKVDGVTRKTVTADSCTQPDNCKPDPFTYDFDGAGFAEGEHEVTVVAKDRLWVAGSPTAANHIRTSPPIKFQLRRAASAEVGPGSVSLRTGVFTHSADDVSIDSFASDLSFSRSYNSYRPADRKNGILGPGWTASLPVDAAGSGYAKLTEEPDGRVVVTDAEGLELAFAKTGSAYAAPTGYPDLKLTTAAGPSFVLSDIGGNSTTFAARAADTAVAGRFVYLPTEIRQPAAGAGVTTVIYQTVNGVNRPTRAIAPAPAGVTCTATSLPAGCRSLELVYASSTTATGLTSGQWGDYTDRLRQVRFTAFDPATGAVATNTVAQYEYDANGLLRAAWDPRVSPALKTTYDYDGGADGNNRLTAVTPPGQTTWTLAYATITSDPQNTWRLKSASRSTPQGMATTTVAFGVPITGAGAPYAMGASNVASWGQSAGAAPVTATAIFAPDHVPANPPASSSYPKADIHYLDANGREVNVASPGGRITTSEYDVHDNVTRELTAENRRRVLAGQGSATQLDTRRTYSADGLELLDEFGPAHDVKLSSGSVVSARAHSSIAYDEGAPSSTFHLPTTTTVSARLANGTDVDSRVAKQTYDWTLRKPTSQTRDAVTGGLNLKTTTLYNSAGLTTETRQPAGPTGGTAHSTKTIYYTAGANLDDAACAGKPQWASLPCKTRPAAQPGIPGKPEIPTSTYTYNRLNQVVTKTDQSGSSTRTTTTTYDAAGRGTGEAVDSSVGTPLPAVELDYDDTTGLLTSTRTTEAGVTRSVERAHDSIGRVVSYADADYNTSTTGYDLLGRVTTTNDGKGTQTRAYDATTGDLVTLQDSALGTITAAYDADGKPTTQTLPNGITAATTYDASGDPTRLRYDKSANCGVSCTWYDDQVTSSIHGEWVEERSTLADRDYTYDQVGRLTRVKDTPSGGQCTVRDYAYDADSNRIRSERRSPNLDGTCNTTTTGAVTLHTYDAADRLIDPGYEYDAFGRITTVPAGDSPTSGATNQYYADDRVHKLDTDPSTVEQRYDLDPLRRVRKETTAGTDAATRLHHYADDSDSPVWTVEDRVGARWTRNVAGIAGGLMAIQDSVSGVAIQLPNLHGDIIATASPDSNFPTLLTTARYDEFGTPEPGTAPARYGWVGAKRRATSQPTGVVLMGQRVYEPRIGRFLQVDPVSGGSANDYDYVNQDPQNQFDLTGQYPGGMNRDEIAWCLTHGSTCARAHYYRVIVGRHLRRFYGGLSRAYDRHRNAFRHCAWSGLMTMAFGSATATGITNRHESGESGDDTKIDQHNNATGRNVGRWWRGRRGAQRRLAYDCRFRAQVHRSRGLLHRWPA